MDDCELMKTIQEIMDRKKAQENKQLVKDAQRSQRKKVYRSIFAHSSESDTESNPTSVVSMSQTDLESPDKGFHKTVLSGDAAEATAISESEKVFEQSPNKMAVSCTFTTSKEELSPAASEEKINQTHLYMGPYGRIRSPFKKTSSFQSFPRGIKRSPR